MKKIILFLVLLGTAGAGVRYAYAEVRARDEAIREAGLELDRLEAEADTARRIILDQAEAFQIRATQDSVRADSLDTLLDARPVVRIPVEIEMDPITVTDTLYLPPDPTTEVETYPLSKEDGPFLVSGSFVRDPPLGIFNVDVSLTRPVQVGVRVHCLDRPGVNAAAVLLTSEKPFSLVPRQPVEQEPDVCNPKPTRFSLLPEISMSGLKAEAARGVAWWLIFEGLEKLFDGDEDYPNEDPYR